MIIKTNLKIGKFITKCFWDNSSIVNCHESELMGHTRINGKSQWFIINYEEYLKSESENIQDKLNKILYEN